MSIFDLEDMHDVTSYIELQQSYMIQGKLGRGTFAQVYKAVHRGSGEIFAVKAVNKHQLDDETKELLKNELRVLKYVSKFPGIVTLYEEFECDRFIWFVLEYVDGGMLLNKLARKGSFSENHARITMISTLRSLLYLSKLGVVHRDVKPENILFDSKSRDWPTRLTDFGLSAKMDKNVLLYAACGTPAFCSPEVLKGEVYDCSCDMWSFGIVLYIVLAGYPPFHGTEDILKGSVAFPEQEWSHISDEAKDVVKKMLIVNPKERITAKKALEHSWFAMTQSTEELPNKKLITFNLRRNMRIRFFVVSSANSLLRLRDRKTERDSQELYAEVEQTRQFLRELEAREGVVEASSPITPAVRHDGTNSKSSSTIVSDARPPPPGSQASILQASLPQPSLAQPSLSQSSVANPSRLRRRQRSLILPSIDFAADDPQSSADQVEFSGDTLHTAEIVAKDRAVMKKAEVLLSNLDSVPCKCLSGDLPPWSNVSTPSPRTNEECEAHQHHGRRDEAFRIDGSGNVNDQGECVPRTTPREQIDSPVVPSTARRRSSGTKGRPNLPVLDFEDLGK